MFRLKFFVMALIVSVGITFTLEAKMTYAQTTENCSAARLRNLQVAIIDCGESNINRCSGVQLSGNDNEEKVWNFLVSPQGMGFTAIQAAGSMGNLKHEGNFNPKIVEGGVWGGRDWPPEMDTIPPSVGPRGQPGYGIVQWTSSNRKQGLQDLANQKNLPVSDLGLQLEYMKQELEGPYRQKALDPLKSTNDLAEATRIWQDHYEVGSGFSPRFQAAQDYMTRFGSNTGGATNNSDSTTCGGSGSVVGGLSLPLDKRWYDENKEWFTKSHHDYPAADIPVPTGTEVYSMTAGTIIKAPSGGACGTGLTVDAGNGVIITYCHGSDGGSVPGANQGSEVRAGQLIMHSANTGRSSGPHLHVQIKYNGTNVCPQNLFVGIAEGNPPAFDNLPTSGCTH